MAIEVVRTLIRASQRDEIRQVSVAVACDVAEYLNNRKRRDLAQIEDEGQMTVHVLDVKDAAPEHLVIDCRDAENREVKFSVS